MSRRAPVLALGLALAACHHPRVPEPSGVPAGLYSGRTPSPGLLQLEVKEGDRVELVHLVTLHLPPAELERHSARLVRGESGQPCLEPPPRTVKPCLERGKGEALVLTLQPEETQVHLQRVEARGPPPGEAPPAP